MRKDIIRLFHELIRITNGNHDDMIRLAADALVVYSVILAVLSNLSPDEVLEQCRESYLYLREQDDAADWDTVRDHILRDILQDFDKMMLDEMRISLN